MGGVGIRISFSYLKNPYDPHSGTLNTCGRPKVVVWYCWTCRFWLR